MSPSFYVFAASFPLTPLLLLLLLLLL